jgi:hypothetical protein
MSELGNLTCCSSRSRALVVWAILVQCVEKYETCGRVMVKALCYKPEGCWFENR